MTKFNKMRLFCIMLLLLMSVGCRSVYPYGTSKKYYTYAATRKLIDDPGVPAVTKVVAYPFLYIPESIISPFTVYKDSMAHPPISQRGHLYLSLIHI